MQFVKGVGITGYLECAEEISLESIAKKTGLEIVGNVRPDFIIAILRY